MNSKQLFFALFFNLLLQACGVKSTPTAPPNTSIPSYIETFLKNSKTKVKNDFNSTEKNLTPKIN